MGVQTVAQPGLRRVLAALCVTEITSWGVLYYAFPVLAGEITHTTGWSAATVTAGFSVGQLTAALAGIPIGRWLDRRGPRWLMTGGSVLAVPAVVALATARNLGWFFTAWLLMGLAMGATLYPPAFAALTRWYGPRRISALTVLTLAGGLASTVFAPLTALLDAHLDWRHTYLVLAGILAVLTIPGHLWGLRGAWPDPEPHDHARPAEHRDPGRVARSRPFVLLVVTLSVAAFTAYAVVVNLVPLLTERGLSPGLAAVALGLGGAGQVLGRLGYTTLVRRTSAHVRTALIVAAVAVTTGVLGLITATPALVAAAVVAGMARGVFTLLQATAVTDRWGATHYGRLTGLLSAPLTTMMSLAPWAGAAIAGGLGGYPHTFLLLASLGAAAALLAPATRPVPSGKDSA
ncbi:MFS transporter [Amycolatopsis acidiphila]|uniref:MFS transporter n=1 Tax=Amycolatopsis acidiphila TaxID=715473 RepID=A0A558A4N5_9PSEU|nr:MFS transporter [Amycolatopsis acidiphila]TVT19206.1 MFS transporter [Amycolatopsis acidiphila]UIJ62026.1 MFS transporter [Amycolatopsis acidiphila]GHG56582.1 putative transporter, MFS family protein [Amycolatopsis acidiphila]